MQELRFVLIIVGALAIAALLFHGLWTSKKEGKSKFGDKPFKAIDATKSKHKSAQRSGNASHTASDKQANRSDDEPDFGLSTPDLDPLISDYHLTAEDDVTVEVVTNTEPSVAELEPIKAQSADDAQPVVSDEHQAPSTNVASEPLSDTQSAPETAEPEMEVIVLNVHCAGDTPLLGPQLFDSLQQNGLLYGELDIYHRHADLSGTGKVLFSVANMMQPGTLKHDDPEQFTTKGISFFMTLPCFGDAEQNFKLMLKTAQQIADDLGANVLDDKRNLMTPNRLAEYRNQIQVFKLRQND